MNRTFANKIRVKRKVTLVPFLILTTCILNSDKAKSTKSDKIQNIFAFLYKPSSSSFDLIDLNWVQVSQDRQLRFCTG